jgi:hypothetical protein
MATLGQAPTYLVSRSPAVLVGVRWALVAAMFGIVGLHDSPALEIYRTHQATGPFAFSLLDWETEQLAPRLGGLLAALQGKRSPPEPTDVATARAYFEAPPGARVSLRREAELAISRLVTYAWRGEKLGMPSVLAGGEPTLFPPVSFAFADPPQVLIVSPRERIEVTQYVLLRPNPSLETVRLLEDGVASRGVSTLVASVGGLASYPAMVLAGGSAESTLAAVAHEWVHAYLFFQPLGQSYWADQDMRTLNETAAELAGNEMGSRLARQLGLPVSGQALDPAGTARGDQTATDPRQREFHTLLRQTRLEVDRLLAAGAVEEAERYMEQRRLELNARGFGLRRLNQAYFAFHGSYAEGPAGSSPLASQVRGLRNRSASLGDFLRTIAQVSRPEQLETL